MTLQQVQKRLDAYLAQEEKILVAQNYGIGGHTVSKARLQEVREGIKELEEEILRLKRGGKITVGRMVPL